MLQTYMPRWRPLPIVKDAPLIVEPENFVRNAGSSSSLDFVQMAEEIETRSAGAVVEIAVRQHAQQRRLAGVGVTEDGQAEIDKMPIVRHFAHEHFQSPFPAMPMGGRSGCGVGRK